MKRICVIGAGPAGLTAALLLAKSRKFEVHLYESDTQVGGMAKSFELWGQRVDLGPHRFFSGDRRVNEIWLEAIGRDYEMVSRLTRIYYKGKFFYYPLKAMNALQNLGWIEAFVCVMSYLRYRAFPLRDESTFEAWVTNRFGRRLYEIFFRTYTEKLWGVSCTELDKEFAAQRIKKFTLLEAVKNAVFGGSNRHQTLVDLFAYPKEGAGQVYENMADRFVESGGHLHLGTAVKRVVSTDHRSSVVELQDGTMPNFDHVISSMPLTTLVKYLEGVPGHVFEACSFLRYRNTILVYLLVDNAKVMPDQWIYIHSPDVLSGRLTNFANWTDGIRKGQRQTILALEYWCFETDEIWSKDEQSLVQAANEDIVKTGLVGREQILAGRVVRIPRCYPVYDRGYQSHLGVIENYLRTLPSLTPIGRYGSFKYNNQDHSILMGRLAAENLISSAGHDLWSVNTDYEYQEASVITETGLELQKKE